MLRERAGTTSAQPWMNGVEDTRTLRPARKQVESKRYREASGTIARWVRNAWSRKGRGDQASGKRTTRLALFQIDRPRMRT